MKSASEVAKLSEQKHALRKQNEVPALLTKMELSIDHSAEHGEFEASVSTEGMADASVRVVNKTLRDAGYKVRTDGKTLVASW